MNARLNDYLAPIGKVTIGPQCIIGTQISDILDKA